MGSIKQPIIACQKSLRTPLRRGMNRQMTLFLIKKIKGMVVENALSETPLDTQSDFYFSVLYFDQIWLGRTGSGGFNGRPMSRCRLGPRPKGPSGPHPKKKVTILYKLYFFCTTTLGPFLLHYLLISPKKWAPAGKAPGVLSSKKENYDFI